MKTGDVRPQKDDEWKAEYHQLELAVKNEKKPLDFVKELVEIMKAIALEKVSGDRADYFIKTMLAKYLTVFLKRSDLDDETAYQVNQFFQKIIQLSAHSIPNDPKELLEALARILTPTQSNFYTKYGREKTKEDFQQEFTNIKLEKNDSPSVFLIANINLFGKEGGFEAIKTRLKSKPKVSLEVMKLLLKPLTKLRDYLIPSFLKGLAEEVRETCFQHILGLTDEELKNEDKKVLTNVSSQLEMLMRHFQPQKVNEAIDKFNLDIALKCFRCPYLEKRVAGLNDIKDFIASSVKRAEIAKGARLPQGSPPLISNWVSPQFLLRWLKENKILDNLYGQNMHPQMMSRSNEILKFFASQNELTTSIIDLVWDASLGKHESIKHIIFATIGDMASYNIPLSTIDYIFDKIVTIPFEAYDLQTLLLVRTFTMYALNQIQNTKNKKTYGLTLLWDIIQDSVVATADVKYQALIYLKEFFGWPQTSHLRLLFVDQCVKNLKKSSSVPQSLQILQILIAEYPAKRKKNDNTMNIVEALQQENQLMDIFFQDLINYKKNAKVVFDTLSPEEKANVNNRNLVGSTPHLVQIRQRTEFLDFILGHSSIRLNTKQVGALWSCLIENGLSFDEKNVGFTWLMGCKEFTNIPSVMSDEAAFFLFEEKVPLLDFASLSFQGLLFVDFYFKFVNFKKQSLTVMDNKERVLSFQLVGLTNLWRVALETIDPLVAKHAIALLISLQKQIAPQLRGQLPTQRKAYLDFCMTQLSFSGSLDQTTELRITRALSIIKTIVDEFENKTIKGVGAPRSQGNPLTVSVKIVGNATSTKHEISMFSGDTIGQLREKVAEKFPLPPNLVRMITGGQELKADHLTLQETRVVDQQQIFATKRASLKPNDESNLQPQPQPQSKELSLSSNQENEDESLLPSSILTTQEYFNQLFQLLTLSDSIGQKVWDLLMLLPPNQKVLGALKNFQSDWEELLDVKSIFKLLYSLQIVDSLVHNGSSESPQKVSEKEEWCAKFVQSGGLNHLLKILMQHGFDGESKGDKRKPCLAILLKIINHFLIDTSIKASPLKKGTIVSPIELINKLIKIMISSAKEADPTESVDSDSITHSMLLLVACCLSAKENLDHFLKLQQLDEWVSSTLLRSPHPGIRKVIADGLHSICLNTSFWSHDAHNLFLFKLMDLLPQVDHFAETCEQYFDILNLLVHDSCNGVAGGKAENFGNLFGQLLEMIKTHPVTETSSETNEDKVLIGLLNLTSTLVSKNQDFKKVAGDEEQGNLIDEIFINCLFDTPTVTNHSPLAPPKCKTRASRNCAFRLLIELGRDSEENFKIICLKLMEQHFNAESRRQWSYYPAGYEKSPLGYVGLKNLGATCYMNSLMQQFYMVPEFRYRIFAVPENSTEKAESLMYQLQHMFGYLQESVKKYYDTRPFCMSYKDNGQPMNPSIQMDADEFFNFFFDKLENAMKSSPQNATLKELFGGTLSNELISRDCPHVSEREETCFTISLEVKNKKSIEESLELYVLGDMLEGDNKYQCGTCSNKVDALKRCCIKTLPKNLILHLKRFEFDIELLKRMKVNDLCEFPTKLNMEPYTKEGLARKEARQKGLPVPDLPHPPPYYEFNLVGVLVHRGTADSGHYYSFIKERGLGERPWFQFNDTDIDPFDYRDIPKSCFGGMESVSSWDPTQQKYISRLQYKIHSAYMLFYEREDYGQTLQIIPPTDASRLVPPPIYHSVWDENVGFYKDKNIFDPDYFSFLSDALRLNPHAPLKDYDHVPSSSDLAMQTIELGTRFLLETLSHAKEKSTLPHFVDQLKLLYQNHIPACKWFLETMIKDTTWLKQLLLVCTSTEARDGFSTLVGHVIGCLVPYERESYFIVDPDEMQVEEEKKGEEQPVWRKPQGKPRALVIQFMDTVFSLLKDATYYWRYFSHLFLVMYDFARIGLPERKYLIDRQAISTIIDFYLAEQSPYADKHSRQKKIKMGDKFTKPNLSFALALMSLIYSNCPPVPSVAATPEQLTLGAIDYQMLLDWKTFWPKALQENLNPKAASEIFSHFSYENETHSATIIKMLCDGLHESDSDIFKHFFDVLTPLLALNDSKHKFRVEFFMKSYLTMLEKNKKYRIATRVAITYLSELVVQNPTASAWLFDNRAKWVEDYLLDYSSEQVRESTETLIMALAYESPREGSIVPTAVNERVHAIFVFLMDLFPNAKRYHPDINQMKSANSENVASLWKLASYFRLVRWSMRTDAEKAVIGKCWTEFIQLLWHIDQPHFECDENKREITNLWYASLVGYQPNIELVLKMDVKRILDYFVSLQPSKRFWDYNNSALPNFYRILLLCCENDTQGSFTENVLCHQNFNWAVNFMLLESGDYPAVANVLFDVVSKMGSKYPYFRQSVLSKPALCERFNLNQKNILRTLDSLLRTPEDFVFAFEKKTVRLDDLVQFLSNRQERELDEEDLRWISMVAGILLRALECTQPDKLTDRTKKVIVETFKNWEPKSLLLFSLWSLLQVISEETILQDFYRLISLLCRIDLISLEKLLSDLLDEHQRYLNYKCKLSTEFHPKPVLRIHQGGNRFTREMKAMYYSFVNEMMFFVLGTQKLVNFYNNAMTIALMVAIETAEESFHSAALLTRVLASQSPTLTGILKDNPYLDHYVSRSFSKELGPLSNPEAFAFLSSAFSLVQKRLQLTNLMANLNEYLQQQLSQGENSNDKAVVELTLSKVINVFKAFQIIMSHSNEENLVSYINQNLARALQFISQLKQSNFETKINLDDLSPLTESIQKQLK